MAHEPRISRHSTDSADVIVPILAEYVPLESVIDFGCKHGEWLSIFRARGASRVRGLDRRNEPGLLLIDPSEFDCTDLSRAAPPTDRYDVSVCVEVAEHLPARAARPLVRALSDAAPVVLFSAAVPGQGGHGHLNEQPHAYWDALFAERGMRRIDCIRPRIWQDPRVAWWYRQNLFLYASAGAIARFPALKRAAEAPLVDDLVLIHRDLLRPSKPLRAISSLRRILAAVFKRPVGRGAASAPSA